MAFCSFSKDAAMYDATPIENIFLMEYLPSAPDEFLRVYLYARMLCLHPEMEGDLADVAKALRMDEETVFNAFAYWEQQGLVERLTDRPPSYAILPVRSESIAHSGMDRDYYAYRDFNSALQALFGGAHLLHPKQYKTANDWLNVLGFSQDAVLRLLEYELSRPGSREPAAVFKRADKRAMEWADRGVRSLEDVERTIAYDERIFTLADRLMKQFSIRRKPTVNELDCVRRWLEEWKLSDEEIIAACDQTTKSRSPSIAYLDAILKARHERGEEKYFEAAKAVLREMGAFDSRPSAEDQQIYASLLERGFEPETISMAAAQCKRKHKHDFAELEWMLGEWAKAGVYTAAQAERYLADMKALTAELRRVMTSAGLSRYPNRDDLARYTAWKEKYSPELIDCAAQMSAGTETPMRYMGKLLSQWESEGVTTPEQARARRTGAGQKSGLAVNHQQQGYRADSLDAGFYYDPLKDYGEEGDAQ